MLSTTVKQLIVFSAFSIFTLMSSHATAVGMGRLNVLSAIGQPLHAEIELISVPKKDAGSIIARLGTPSAYERSNLQLGAAGSAGIRVSVERRRNGVPYVRVTSGQRVNEPFINLVIELSSPAGLITREFSVLLDPPEIPPAKPVAESRPLVAAPVTASSALAPPAPTDKVDVQKPDSFSVQRGDTLSRIARRVQPQSATLQQTMMGIFHANTSAFINNNINLLKAGQRLRIPDASQLSSIGQGAATREVRTHTAAWRGASRRNAPETAMPEKAPEPNKGATPVAVRGAEPRKEVVKLSRSAPTAGKGRSTEERLRMLEEELIAREKALNDANERIRKLEKAVMQAAPAAALAPAKK
jgi:pilus assembly protein FimV